MPSTSGVNRKVAESLQLFKETAKTPTEEIPHLSLGRRDSVSKKRQGSVASLLDHHEHEDSDIGEAEPEFKFVTRSQWPDRETAALRREKSMHALEYVRSRDSASSVSGVRERDKERDFERSDRYYELSTEDKRGSRAGSTARELLQFGKDGNSGASGVLSRGRSNKRPPWKDITPSHDLDGTPTTLTTKSPSDSSLSASSTGTLQEKLRLDQPLTLPVNARASSSSSLHVYPPSPSPSRSPSRRVTKPSQEPQISTTATPPHSFQHVPTFARTSSPQPIIPPAQLESELDSHRDSTLHPPSPLPTSRLRRQLINAAEISPIAPPPPTPTPFSTDDDQDFDLDSEWDTASVTTSASTQTSPALPSPDVPLHQLPPINASAHSMLFAGKDDIMHPYNNGFGRFGLRDYKSPERTKLLSPANRSHNLPGMLHDDVYVSRKRTETLDPDNEALVNLDAFEVDEHLPHIPLRPFRNQVGGHSAIYKFTKRAVCKVSKLISRRVCFRSRSQIALYIYFILSCHVVMLQRLSGTLSLFVLILDIISSVFQFSYVIVNVDMILFDCFIATRIPREPVLRVR